MTTEREHPLCVRRLIATARNSVLFLAGLFGCGAVQTLSVTVPEPGILGRKFAHFEEQGGRYSFVFIGSSRVAHHFIPEQFDAQLQQHGIEVKSFNFGQDGMFPPESFYVLRKLLAHTPMRPRWVAIDVMPFRPVMDGNEESERTIAWHDWRHTALTARVLKGDFFYHARLLATRTLGAGRWQSWLQREAKLNLRKPTAMTSAGYEALETRPLNEVDAQEFDKSVERLKGTTKWADLPSAYRQELEAVVALIREHGAEPIFVLAPDIHSTQRFRDWPPAGVAEFAYDHPETYPTLYLREQRYDPEHLDANGAKEFTRIFATEFADWMKRK